MSASNYFASSVIDGARFQGRREKEKTQDFINKAEKVKGGWKKDTPGGEDSKERE